MACTVEQFRIRFSEFSDDVEYTDARIQLFLDDATCFIGTNESRWCGKYDLAHCYLGAHFLTEGIKTEVGDSSASTGPVISKSAGGVSVTKANVAKDRSDADSMYSSTSYGMKFLSIRGSCFVGVVVANCL